MSMNLKVVTFTFLRQMAREPSIYAIVPSKSSYPYLDVRKRFPKVIIRIFQVRRNFFRVRPCLKDNENFEKSCVCRYKPMLYKWTFVIVGITISQRHWKINGNVSSCLVWSNILFRMFDDLDFVSSNQSFPHKKIKDNYLITFVFIAIYFNSWNYYLQAFWWND